MAALVALLVESQWVARDRRLPFARRVLGLIKVWAYSQLARHPASPPGLVIVDVAKIRDAAPEELVLFIASTYTSKTSLMST